MASSDDESEELLQSVSNYHLEDENFEPVSFCVLPIQWSEEDRPVGKQIDVSLRGSADKGLQKVFKQVVAWKYDISSKNPEVYVLSKENVWIKLQQPKKSFEETIRSVLVTVQCLHFVKKNPEISGKPMWDHLSKAFSWYDLLPNENDLMDHITLIREAVKRNTDLEKSKFLHALLEEKPGKRKSYGEDAQPTKKTRFMVDDDDDGDDMYEDEIAERDDSDDIFDSVCAICDNGGELVCCEGICLRSFHATVEAGSESLCDSLGFSKREIDAIDFKCENCLYQQHQCFVCGKLGSSKESDAEVSKCLNATCGFFYHPHCVSKLIHQNDKAAAEELEKRMAQGDRVTCPIHKCCVCGQGENREVLELQFAVCRRCPRSYHRKCLPKNIAFEDDEDNGIITRAWDDLLPSRILIYCLDHKIEKEIGTPIRSHIVFPSSKKTDIKKKKVFVEAKKIKQTTPSPRNAEKVASKKINIIPRDSTEGTIAVKRPRLNDRSASAMKLSSNKHIEKKTLPGSDVPRKVKADNSSRKPLNDNAKFIPVEADKDALGNKLFEFMQKSELVKPGKVDTHAGEPSKLATVEAETKELSSALPPLDVESRRRILSLMKDAASSISLEDVKKEYDVPSTHAHSSIVDKFMTEGKVQGAVEAARTALKKLEEGCSMEDAAAVCNKHVLKQLFKWRNQLRGYLAPFQYGMRYTSFGRHFTQLDKLQKIVDKLHWYVKDGDMIVDFCCGANDFSILMKKKLEETGKKCSYKNYDIMPPKNDFCYEKRDWMTVEPKELPSGSQLIMGLNPPFGIQAQLANKFINKALEFKPKLLILIAPPETEKLDEKNTPYDLVWEDYQVLSGKSFYLPGSVDVNDKQMEQWNVTPPLLCLWSRPDWSSKHLEIAEKHGQNSVQPENSDFRKNSSGTFCPDHPLDDQEQNVVIPSLSKNNLPIQANEPEGSAIETAVREGSSSARSGTSLGSSREKEGRGNILEEEKEDITNNERSSVSLEVVQNSKLGGMRNYQPLRVETPYGGTLGSLPDEPGRVYRSWPSELNPGWNINQEFVGSRRGNLADEYRWSSYMIEQEEKNRREFELRDRLRLYGQQQDSGYGQMGQFASSYGHHQYGPVAEPVYRMSSTALGPTSSVPTMRRYEPKLDELNHTRVNGLGPPGPGFRGIPGPYPMNFASGPHPASYPHHESSSWLNE